MGYRRFGTGVHILSLSSMTSFGLKEPLNTNLIYPKPATPNSESLGFIPRDLVWLRPSCDSASFKMQLQTSDFRDQNV